MTGVTVAVTNFNGEAYLRDCLRAVRALEHPVAEVIVVDNASTDASRKIVAEEFPGVRLVALPENRGPGPARNASFREAKTRYVFQIDNDAIVTPRCLGPLQDALREDPEAAIAEPRALDAADPTRVDYDGAFVHYVALLHLRNHGQPLAQATTKREPIDAAISVALLLDRERLGGDDLYDEDLFFYFEDFDFTFRTRLRGHRILSVPESIVHHRAGTAGLSFRQGREYSSRRAYYFSRNRWHLIWKSYRLRTIVLCAPALALYELAWIAFLTTRGQLGAWLRAMAALAREAPGIREKRRAFQARRKIARDRDVLSARPLTFLVEGGKTSLPVRILSALFAAWWKVVRPLV
ncbi:MAG: glycosyltransferase family 2 protein [Planctomycetes bacterium]|nr:glycosyltransferase family 2 protein [Planctomycetota bacterium]MBI3847703.1 glycosyltransferase family 2 protein [Planctomycetota bacterium]